MNRKPETLSEFVNYCKSLTDDELSALVIEEAERSIELKAELAECKANGARGNFTNPKDYGDLVDEEAFYRRKVGWLQQYEASRRRAAREQAQKEKDATFERAFIRLAKTMIPEDTYIQLVKLASEESV